MLQSHAEVKQQMPHVWRLDALKTSSAEDRHRADAYKAEAERKALLSTCASRADFHRELQVQITFQDLCGANHELEDRVMQMQQRTNQFNAWKRNSVPATALSRCEGFVMRVSDRYGDYGV